MIIDLSYSSTNYIIIVVIVFLGGGKKILLLLITAVAPGISSYDIVFGVVS